MSVIRALSWILHNIPDDADDDPVKMMVVEARQELDQLRAQVRDLEASQNETWTLLEEMVIQATYQRDEWYESGYISTYADALRAMARLGWEVDDQGGRVVFARPPSKDD